MRHTSERVFYICKSAFTTADISLYQHNGEPSYIYIVGNGVVYSARLKLIRDHVNSVWWTNFTIRQLHLPAHVPSLCCFTMQQQQPVGKYNRKLRFYNRTGRKKL